MAVKVVKNSIRMSVICQTSEMKTLEGFSLIELIVVLTLVSLATALVLPNLSGAYQGLVARSELDELLLEIASLSYEAYSSGRAISISSQEALVFHSGLNSKVEILKPLEVTSTGVCLGGEFVFSRGDVRQRVSVFPPYCAAEVTADVP